MEQKKEELDKINKEINEILVHKYSNKYGRTLRTLLVQGKFPDKELEDEYNRLYDEKVKQSNEKEVLTKQLTEKNKEIADFTDTLQRLQAEFENYKKRIDKEN